MPFSASSLLPSCFFFSAPSPWHIGMRSKAKVNLHLTCQGVFETAWDKTGRRQAPLRQCAIHWPRGGGGGGGRGDGGFGRLPFLEDWEEEEEVRAALEDLAAERSRREVQEFLEEVEQEEQWLGRTAAEAGPYLQPKEKVAVQKIAIFFA